MINIKILAVGKIKEKFTKDEIDEYSKRLSRYCLLKIIEVDDSKIKDNASLKEEELVLKEEGDRLLKQIKNEDYVILLDLHGKEMDSVSFSQKLEEIKLKNSSVTFVIGGSLGLDDRLRKRANMALKLSEMTFTHQMTRVIILEQIYRAFKIENHEVYHK